MVTNLVLVFIFSPGMAGISWLFWFPSQSGVACLPGEAGRHLWFCSPGPRLWSVKWEPGFWLERHEQALLGHLGRWVC